MHQAKAHLRIATRGSELAVWQANFVKSKLEQLGVQAKLVLIQTQGDREQGSFSAMQGQGFFTKAIQEALLEGRADLAVHSHKDLPSASAPGLVVAAIPERDDARELLLVRSGGFDAKAGVLPLVSGASVGSSAVRRQAQVQALRPDVRCLELRGNVPTRVQKLRDGLYDSILVAQAGINRLGLDLGGLETVLLEPDKFMPAPAQGALAIECRSDDLASIQLLGTLDDPQARQTVMAERGLMAMLAGGCQLALGAHARLAEQLELMAWFEGRFYQANGETPEIVSQKLFQQLPKAAGMP